MISASSEQGWPDWLPGLLSAATVSVEIGVRFVSDRLEIGDLLVRYCTAIDSKRYDDLDSVFTREAVIDIDCKTIQAKGILNAFDIFELTAIHPDP